MVTLYSPWEEGTVQVMWSIPCVQQVFIVRKKKKGHLKWGHLVVKFTTFSKKLLFWPLDGCKVGASFLISFKKRSLELQQWPWRRFDGLSRNAEIARYHPCSISFLSLLTAEFFFYFIVIALFSSTHRNVNNKIIIAPPSSPYIIKSRIRKVISIC